MLARTEIAVLPEEADGPREMFASSPHEAIPASREVACKP